MKALVKTRTAHAAQAAFAAVVSLVLVLTMCAAAFASGGKYIIDKYDLLDSATQQSMEAQAKSMASAYDTGTYLLIVDDIGSKSARDFAKGYWSKKNLGVGSSKSGTLFLIAVDSRDYVTITHGQALDTFTDYRIDAMEEDIVDYLANDEWEDACQTYLDDCQETFEFKATHNVAMDYDTDPASSSYDDGVIGFDDLAIPAGIAFVIALIVMICVRLALKAQLNSVDAQDSARAFMDRPVDITHAEEVFGGTVVTKTPIPKSNSSSGGGGSWSDSGGFGGSSGGKF